MSPQISVIMPCYNAENYVKESINSILNQTFKDFEFIIINDGSEDKSQQIIDSFNDSRLKVVNQSNQGLPFSLNRGLKLATGEFIARMDADDIALKERFEKQIKCLRDKSDVVLVGTNSIKIDKDGKYVCITDMPTVWEDIESQFPHPQIIHPTILFRRLEAEKAGGYPDLPMGEDIMFYNNLAKYGKLINLAEPLLKYRIHPTAFSRKSSKIKQLTKQMFEEYAQSGKINENVVEEIKKYRSLDSKKDKTYDYHVLLAKKYLWNNYDPKQSRFHLKKAFKKAGKFKYMEVLLLISFSFLGHKMLVRIHKFVKGNR